jgi:hypothetical protein
MRLPVPAEPVEPRSAAKNQIEAEHRQLDRLLVSLAVSQDLVRARALLSELATLLRHHFETEEGPQGLHEVVGEQSGHQLATVQRLFDEHADLLVRVEQLRIEVADCLDGPIRRTLGGIAALVEQLRRHEADEDALFAEAFYGDIGGHSD